MTLQNKNLTSFDIAAIVPAYNEGARIKNVLETLISSGLFKEIVVINDGSVDETESIVKEFSGITYLKNEQNCGKGYSLERAVKSTISPIIFFCDADLRGLEHKHLKEIIEPVVSGKYAMFIGVRKNILQNTMSLVALNSGERAMKREVWEQLPSRYKIGFRVEIALNVFTKRRFGGFGYKKLGYYQTLKEKKYGFIKGIIQRVKLNYDVFISWFLISVMENIKEIKLHFDF
jgi:glycosyltransferase involved in cell wall biosynthesis